MYINERHYRAWALVGCVLILFGSVSSLSSEDPEHSPAVAIVTPEDLGLIDQDGATWEGSPASSDKRMVIEAQHRIAGSVLRPRSSNPTFSSITPGCIYAETDSFEVWNAPVYLPQGATVDEMRFYFYDGSVAYDSIAWFTAYDYQGNIAEEWGVQSFGSAGSGYANTGSIDHVINYTNYSYAVNWRPYEVGSGMQVCGFRIWYTMP